MRHGGIAALAALLVAGCATAPPRGQEAARPTAWRIAAIADVSADLTHKAAAAAILAYLQDTPAGISFAAGEYPLCLGVGPASGGSFRYQPLEDLEPELIARIARTRPNVRPVSECATTLKGAPYRLDRTGEPAQLLTCLSAGETAPSTVSLLCGWYGGPLTGEFVGYDAELSDNAMIVRRNGNGILF